MHPNETGSPVKSKDNVTEGRPFPQMIMLPTLSFLLCKRF
jgi:hypothetical protein